MFSVLLNGTLLFRRGVISDLINIHEFCENPDDYFIPWTGITDDYKGKSMSVLNSPQYEVRDAAFSRWGCVAFSRTQSPKPPGKALLVLETCLLMSYAPGKTGGNFLAPTEAALPL